MSDNPWNLSEAALRIATERPPLWQYRLFAQSLIDEIDRSRSLQSAPPLGSRPHVPFTTFREWFHHRGDVMMRLIVTFLSLFGRDSQISIGPSPGDSSRIPEVLTFTSNISTVLTFSRKLATCYRQAIEWRHSVRNADVDAFLREATYEYSFTLDSLISVIEAIGPGILRQAESAVERAKDVSELESFHVDWAPILEGLALASAFDVIKRVTERLTNYIANGEANSTPGRSGYLYILTNVSLGNVIKIGKTRRHPRQRIDELSGATAIPTPFVLAFDAYVEDCDEAEAYVHARLERDGYRVAKNREFFNVDVTTATAVILEAQRIVSSRAVNGSP